MESEILDLKTSLLSIDENSQVIAKKFILIQKDMDFWFDFADMIKEKYNEIKNANEKLEEIMILGRPSSLPLDTLNNQDESDKHKENNFIKKEFFLAVADIFNDVEEEYKNPDILIQKFFEYSKEYWKIILINFYCISIRFQLDKTKILEGLNQVLAPFAEIDILYFDPFGVLLEENPSFQNPNFLDLPTFRSIIRNKTNCDKSFVETLEDVLFCLLEKVI